MRRVALSAVGADGACRSQLPNLASASDIQSFYRSHAELLRVVILLTATGYVFLLCFLSGFVEWVRQVDGSGPLTWLAFGSALMFMTSLNIALALSGTAALVSTRAGVETIATLHRAAFVLAAPVAPAGVAFFAAMSAISLRTGALPRAIGWVGIAAAVANLGALGGLLSLTGPLNSGNGAIGGIAAPIIAWLVWILVVSAWLARSPEQHGQAA